MTEEELRVKLFEYTAWAESLPDVSFGKAFISRKDAVELFDDINTRHRAVRAARNATREEFFAAAYGRSFEPWIHEDNFLLDRVAPEAINEFQFYGINFIVINVDIPVQFSFNKKQQTKKDFNPYDGGRTTS